MTREIYKKIVRTNRGYNVYHAKDDKSYSPFGKKNGETFEEFCQKMMANSEKWGWTLYDIEPTGDPDVFVYTAWKEF